MKYKVTVTKRLFGEIIVDAQNKDDAAKKAYTIADSDKNEWYSESKVDIHEAHEIPLICSNCGKKLPAESLFCNMCGTKTENQ